MWCGGAVSFGKAEPTPGRESAGIDTCASTDEVVSSRALFRGTNIGGRAPSSRRPPPRALGGPIARPRPPRWDRRILLRPPTRPPR